VKGIPGLPFKFIIPGEGYSLLIVYGVWLAVVIGLYPLCKWYDKYKTNHKEKKVAELFVKISFTIYKINKHEKTSSFLFRSC
jgi:hypothetical protein